MSRIELTEKKYKRVITILSIIIPVAVAALFGINLRKLGFDVEPLRFLPPIYATVNGITAVLLIAAVIAIKNGNNLEIILENGDVLTFTNFYNYKNATSIEFVDGDG